MASHRPKKLQLLLAHPRLPLLLAGLAILVSLPVLWTGWAMDDYVLRYAAAGGEGVSPELQKPTGSFGFLGDPEVVQRLKDTGGLPWWTVDGLRLSFWRPLASLTHWLDFQLWPENPFLMHLHSLLLYGLLVALATLLYRQLMTPPWVAGLAALLFAVDDAHSQPVAWISARNSLLAALFGVLALMAHDRWRRHGWRPGAVLGPAAFLLGLLSKELGVAIGGYLLAYALFLDRGSWRRRLAGLLPYGGLLVAWRALYQLQGYGVIGSGMYLDPLAEPLAFAQAVVQRIPLLILGLWGQPPADFALVFPPPIPTLMWMAGMVGSVLLVVLLRPLLRSEATARFWAAGMILSLLPLATGFPANRYLLIPGLGAMGLLALFLGGWSERWPGLSPTPAWHRLARAAAVLLIGIHLVLAPLLLTFGILNLDRLARAATRPALDLPDDPDLSRQKLVVVNAPDFLLFIGYLFSIRYLEDLPVARRQVVLATGVVELELARIDEHTLLVRSGDGFPSGITDPVYRSRPFVPGERIQLPDLTVEVREVNQEKLVTEALFRFDVRLEDPSLRWVRWQDGVLVPFQPPAVGATSKLPAPTLPF
jgi:hypothetical protein